MNPRTYVLKTSSVFLLALCARAGIPLDTAGLITDYQKCAQENADRRDKLSKAISARVDRDLSSAPACFKDQKIDPAALGELGVRTDSANITTALMASGVVYLAPDLSPECLSQICTWQAKVEPDRDRLFCERSS